MKLTQSFERKIALKSERSFHLFYRHTAKLFLEKGEGERVRFITISHFHEFNKCAGSAKIFLNEKSTPIGTLSSLIVAAESYNV